MGNSINAVLKTLIYSDIFDYPLKKQEIYKYLIENKRVSEESFDKILSFKNHQIVLKDNYYCLLGRENIIKKRIQREKESKIKLQIAQTIIKRISFLPTILFIGISGALAMGNAEKKDDIDLFIITQKNTLWFTRLFLIFLLKGMGKYRKRGDKNVANKICLNMFLDENNLELPVERQNLYSAHEIVQLLPIFQRQNTYQRFLNSNKWVNKFLSNAINKKVFNSIKSRKYFFSPVFNFIFFFLPLELLSKKIQLHFIEKHKTVETVSDKLLAFHPIDYNKQTILLYANRLKKYGLSIQ